MSELVITDLQYRYSRGHPLVLDNLSLRTGKGEIVGILGASGCGKSTLLRLIAGLETPEKGIIRLGELTLTNASRSLEPAERRVGMVFQDYALFPHLTVAANIAFGLVRLGRSEKRKRLGEMLELTQMEPYADRYPHELSGGQQQRVALARALAPKPELLMMDEPFTSLDAELRQSIREELRELLRSAGISCLLVSHDREDIAAICNRALRVQEGRLHPEPLS